MNRTMKHGLVAAVLFGGAALISAPASANSVHDEGYFGGGYTSIGPGPYYQRRGAGRIGPLHERRAYVYGPRYYFGPGLRVPPLRLRACGNFCAGLRRRQSYQRHRCPQCRQSGTGAQGIADHLLQ